MEKTYWIRRQRDALTMARAAATSEARLTHYELAGRYSIRAAHSLPSTLPDKRPSTGGTDRAPLATPAHEIQRYLRRTRDTPVATGLDLNPRNPSQ